MSLGRKKTMKIRTNKSRGESSLERNDSPGKTPDNYKRRSTIFIPNGIEALNKNSTISPNESESSSSVIHKSDCSSIKTDSDVEIDSDKSEK